jgi:glycosyltransferase involved in cell wall biosynthesis
VKVALVHDWLTGMRGGERVLERMCRLFPQAPIYTLLWKRGALSPTIESHAITTTFVQDLPFADRLYRWYLPLYDRAIESVKLEGYDAVISSSHAVAKGVPVPRGTFHLSYVYTPMRYVYEFQEVYFPKDRFPWPLSWYVHRTLKRLRAWDQKTAGGPDAYVAISRYVAARIERWYRRPSEVVYPPVDVERLQEPGRQEATRHANGRVPLATPPVAIGRPFYLAAGAFAPYKRTELAIEACVRLGKRLVVVGSGQDEKRLRKYAKSGVEFVGWTSDAHLAEIYRHAQALLYPGEEDFGIVPVEAMASGCPVIAFGRGGALESVGRGASREQLKRVESGGTARVPGGVLFGAQSVEGVMEGIRMLEKSPVERGALSSFAAPFNPERFDREFLEVFHRSYEAWRRKASETPARV